MDACDLSTLEPIALRSTAGTHTFACAVCDSACACFALQVVDLPGGPLTINWDEATNKVFMTGAAQKVFDGVLTL